MAGKGNLSLYFLVGPTVTFFFVVYMLFLVLETVVGRRHTGVNQPSSTP